MCDTCPSRRTVLTGAAAAGLGLTSLGLTAPVATASTKVARLLVFSRTTGFRHTSIETGVATVTALGAEHGFSVEATEDRKVFRAKTLRRFDAVLFLNTTGNVLDDRGRTALRRHVLDGAGWAGVHSAADTEYDWPFYTRLLAGARFLSHPLQQPGVIVREDAHHRSTRHLPERWRIKFEEFYSFTVSPRGRARILLRIDESSYLPDPNTSHLPPLGGLGVPGLPSEFKPVSGRMGDHPMAWTHRVGDGRCWYTALGHEAAMYDDPAYRTHLAQGLLAMLRHGRRRT